MSILQLKRWERKECKPNSLPVLHKMHVRLGDTVKVISGHDKGKIGEITEIIKHNSKIVVKEVNLKTKHVKSRSEEEPGQIVKVLSRFLSSLSCLKIVILRFHFVVASIEFIFALTRK